MELTERRRIINSSKNAPIAYSATSVAESWSQTAHGEGLRPRQMRKRCMVMMSRLTSYPNRLTMPGLMNPQ